MATLHHALIVTGLLFCFFSATVVGSKGTATYYTPPYTPSACNGFKEDGIMIAAASNAIWGGGAACGKKYKVKCVSATNKGVPKPCKRNKQVVVTIVDFWPPPSCHGTIDLSQEAFGIIADLDAGNINIDFQQYGKEDDRLLHGVEVGNMSPVELDLAAAWCAGNGEQVYCCEW